VSIFESSQQLQKQRLLSRMRLNHGQHWQHSAVGTMLQEQMVTAEMNHIIPTTVYCRVIILLLDVVVTHCTT